MQSSRDLFRKRKIQSEKTKGLGRHRIKKKKRKSLATMVGEKNTLEKRKWGRKVSYY